LIRASLATRAAVVSSMDMGAPYLFVCRLPPPAAPCKSGQAVIGPFPPLQLHFAK
jgi:hypothetical protein